MTPAKKTGRPPQTDRTSVRIPCSKAERDAWMVAARRAERTLNGWIRETLRKEMTMKTSRPRYYVMIKTAPEQSWMCPSGWASDDLDEAIRMHGKAAEQWMAARLMDEMTGVEVKAMEGDER